MTSCSVVLRQIGRGSGLSMNEFSQECHACLPPTLITVATISAHSSLNIHIQPKRTNLPKVTEEGRNTLRNVVVISNQFEIKYMDI
jgi:hypothetical protein